LAAIAFVALIIGADVGAGSGGSGHRAQAGAVPAVGFFARLRALAGTGPGSLAATEEAAQDAAIDRTLTYTPLVRVAGTQHREIALTFDDGPGPYTPAILAELGRLGVPATFFAVGVLEKYFHASTAEEVARGYPIGDHTMGHAPMGHLSPADQKSQLLQQISAIGDYGAPFPRLFRPPYGLWNDATLKLLHKFRMLMVLWTIDSSDYRQPGVEAIVNAVLSKAQPGAIVLLHDAGGNRQQTVDAVPQLVAALRDRGYKLVTVPQLLLDNPPPADQSLPPGVLTGD
jgi:peptidoglycan/xylan/chitin deacetylase (PgdA/CDA1 family)